MHLYNYSTSFSQLCKVLMEKMYHERIRTSIEQLKMLFCQTIQMPEEQAIELDQADILDIAVCLLRQRSSTSYMRGFSQCLQETLRHVSLHAHLQPRDREAVKRFYVRQRTNLQMGSVLKHGEHRSTKRSSRNRVALWRPWKSN